MNYQRYLFWIAPAVLVLGMAGCHHSDGDHSNNSMGDNSGSQAPPSDAFITQMLAFIATSPEDAEPVSTDTFTATMPENTEPVVI